jgi:hypothetical protein
VRINLQAVTDQLYENVTDWHAVLPNDPALEFWTAAQGGTRLNGLDASGNPIDAAGDLINQPFSGDGTFDETVWVSEDPTNVAGGSCITFEAELPCVPPIVQVAACAPTMPAPALSFVQECALLSNAVYGNGGKLPPGWNVVRSFNKPSGIQATLYNEPTTAQYVLAFKGTVPTSMEAIQADVGQLVNGTNEISGQYKDAIAIAKQVNDLSENLRTAGSTLTLTGHSLGGGLASFAALEVGLPAYTFNAAGLGEKTITALIADGVDLKNANLPGQQIDSYYITGEALTEYQTGRYWPYLVLTRPGRQIALAPPAGITNPLKLHSISSVLKALGL